MVYRGSVAHPDLRDFYSLTTNYVPLDVLSLDSTLNHNSQLTLTDLAASAYLRLLRGSGTIGSISPPHPLQRKSISRAAANSQQRTAFRRGTLPKAGIVRSLPFRRVVCFGKPVLPNTNTRVRTTTGRRQQTSGQTHCKSKPRDRICPHNKQG